MSNFTGGITVSVDGTFIDVNAAVNATVNIALTGATCTMKIDDIRFGYTAAENTVKVDADYDLIGNTKSTGSPTYNIGSCVDASGTIVLPKMTSG